MKTTASNLLFWERALMNPRNVWGMIIIILGVLSVLGAMNGFYELYVFEQDTVAMSKMVESSPFASPEIATAFGIDTDNVKKSFNQERIKCFAALLLGILLSVVGTLMLKKKVDEIPNQLDIDYESEDFTFDEAISETNEDDTRWMPPEMREGLRRTKNSSFKF